MLKQKLLFLQQSRFTGKLEIKSSLEISWKIYFCLGRIIWADGGEHPNRFWLNYLSKYRDRPLFCQKTINSAQKFECWSYRLLKILLEREQIEKAEFSKSIEQQNKQIFFDIIQAETSQSLEYTTKETCGEFLFSCGLTMSSTILNVEKIISSCLQKWSDWCDRGLQEISPNFAPNILKKELLKAKVSPVAYENLSKLINGQRTLRELASLLNRDLAKLTSSLLVYINEGIIKLIKVEDLPAWKFTPKPKNTSRVADLKQRETENKPLVACIDDSSQIIFLMERIITNTGYNFLGIKEPMQAIPKLILAQPDLIFLDIGMPGINGYELCAQLRKVSQLKNKPIVMLTSQNSIVDRVRAKALGATRFISKPTNIATISTVIAKFLPSKNNGNKLEEKPLELNLKNLAFAAK